LDSFEPFPKFIFGSLITKNYQSFVSVNNL